jgi:hypothetical protein
MDLLKLIIDEIKVLGGLTFHPEDRDVLDLKIHRIAAG